MAQPTAATSSQKKTTGISQPARIEDHALIGDMKTAALVTRDGTIDWLCVPAFDSDAAFASLVGTKENGSWTLRPTAPIRSSTRRYREASMILETELTTDDGKVRIVDFMPPGDAPVVVRTIQGLAGKVRMKSEVTPRFAFGLASPRIVQSDGSVRMYGGGDSFFLRCTEEIGGQHAAVELDVSEGQKISFQLAWAPSWKGAPDALNPAEAEKATEKLWSDWTARIRLPPEYKETVLRSLLTLKACIFEETGGVVAAPTTSLPETPGGSRNWDYRFCWLRDASLTFGALMAAGLLDEALDFRDWMLRAIAGDPKDIQIMYGLRGERRLTEAELPWLDGYGGAKPVRVGNAAYEQFQLDVLGEVAATIYGGAVAFNRLGKAAEDALISIAEFVAENWKRGDHGIWEMRGPERNFTSSKVSAWVAIDRAVRAVEELKLGRDVEHLRKVRQEIHDEVCREGFNARMNSFTQYYGGTSLDGSLLAIPLSGFLPADDPRVVGTVAAIEKGLMEGGLVLRFKPETSIDGLEGKEGVFLACSFWLVDVYELMGRHADALALFERLLALQNDLGLLAEEYDPEGKVQLGNFPQAFSHFTLVRSAYLVTGSRPVGHLLH